MTRTNISLDEATETALKALQARLGLASRSAAIRTAALFAERATRNHECPAIDVQAEVTE